MTFLSSVNLDKLISLSRRRWWHPTPVLLPGKSHGRRGLVGCSPWGREESDTTEQLHFIFSLSCIGEGNGNPLQCSCLENPRDGGAWWAAVYGVAQSQTRLKWLSSSSSIECVQLQDVNHLIMEVQTNGDMSLLCNRNSGGRRLLALVQCSAVWKLISLPLTLPFLQNLRFSTAVSALSPCWKQEEGRIYLSSYLCLIGLIKHK